ncbi:bromodomain-containing protein 8-like isoform X3 [Pocillopora verrucosa]|uniref:bromodomain-containing protein 8-like isoform X3 n=1 Tax=Pocillopora verrucosa TaxID=203993 RepID=UPI0027971BA4|nr:bromodomain-containing protein 8-like isoform X3 [Pocillopora verrucosa]
MAASMLSQKQKLPSGQSSDEWTIREKLALASSVVRSGDQNWVSVSRGIKPLLETGCCAKPRPPDFFSQKNCAVHYSEMLEKVNTPKRKRTNEGGGAETPGDQIVRKLTFDRIEELKKSIRNDQQTYKKLKDRIEEVRSGKLDLQLPALWEEIKMKKKMRPPPAPQQEGDSSGPVTPTTPTTPTMPITPTTPGAQPGVQTGGAKPQGSQPLSSPQKGKQLRVPKPTAKFQKYQKQLQQRHGHSSQSSPISQTPDGLATTPVDRSPLDGGTFSPGLGGGPSGGLGQSGSFPSATQSSKGEPMDVDLSTILASDSQGDMVPQASPRKTDRVPQSPLRPQSGASAPAVASSQGSNESPLVSLLSQPSSKDSKQIRRASNPEQEMPPTKELESHSSQSGQLSEPLPTPHSTASQGTGQTSDPQKSDGKHFLGVTPSMEPAKLDSMRERTGNTPQVAAPSVTAPTLSKLLADTPATSPSVNSVSSLGGAVPKTPGGMDSSVLVEPSTGTPVENPLSVIGSGRGTTGGTQAVLSVSTPMPAISVNPKAAALTATLPSPLAITPPPTTPPADRKEIIAQKFEPAVKNSEKNSGTEITSDDHENDANTARASTERSAPIPEVKVETIETPVSSPRVQKRASKPGRPGRPSRAARRNQRHRSKSATSTDNEGDVEEDHEEESKMETLDVESEKASEKTEDEEENESIAEEKKEDSDEEMERDSGDEAVSDQGDQSQSEKDEPCTSMKEFLMDKAGSESVPGSPASQVSQGSSDEQEAIQAQKTWKKSIMLVWRAAANHKYANVFLHPVTDDEAPGYHGIVFRPMDLSTIKKNIENGTIRTTSEFQRDMMLMFQNALMYNSADHDVYRMAEEMRDDVMEQIQSYIATQIMVDSKMLRGHRQDVFHIFL